MYEGTSTSSNYPSDTLAVTSNTTDTIPHDSSNASIEVLSLETSLTSNVSMPPQEAILITEPEKTKHTMPVVDGNHSTTPIISFSQNWSPSDGWLKRCIQREKRNPRNFKKSYRSQWPHYQLGDCLLVCKSCKSSMSESRVKESSIVGHYWKDVCHEQEYSETFNLTYLTQLFEKFDEDPHPYRHPWRRPATDELVIHLRIGDVIDESRYSGNTTVFQMLREGADTRHGKHSFYQKGIKSVKEYISTIRESGLQKVVLRGGSHFPKKYPKSRIYTKCLSEAIEKAGFTITSVQVDGEDNPDQDFFYMSHAKHFVQATGGYSRLIASMVKHNGGRILGRVPVQDKNHTDDMDRE
jgi:hypothetical protein